MITDAFDTSAPLFTPGTFYGPGKDLADICIPIFSRVIYERLVKAAAWEPAGRLNNCNGSDSTRVLHVFLHGGRRIVYYLSQIGSALAANDMIECAHQTGARTFIMFGSCGSLDAKKTAGRYIVPTEAYRDEGFSYHYAPASDYITVRESGTVAAIFDELKVPYVQGRVWTTDAFYRETVNKAEARRKEGCLAVEMEAAGAQALADFEGFRLYYFLQTGDVLDEETYSVGTLKEVNHNVDNLALALELCERVPLAEK